MLNEYNYSEQTDVLLSIVIPIYNAEKYLEECLDSILDQNIFENLFEIVCVDDGSTDSSASILKEYAHIHDNIKFFCKTNGGVSSARNLGIEKSRGKWIWFIDADDYISKNCCDTLLKYAEKDVDLLCFAGKNVVQHKSCEFHFSEDMISFVEGTNAVLNMSPKKSYSNGPCYYFFKREKIVKQMLFFDESMKYGEDTKFIFEYKFFCQKAVLVDAVVYFYRQNPQSAMGNINAHAHADSMWKLAELYDKYLELSRSNNKLQNQFEVARCRAVRAMLFDNCIYIRDYNLAKESFVRAKKRGWIPFNVKLGVYSKSFKGILINLFNEIMEIEWIYLLICRLRSKKKK